MLQNQIQIPKKDFQKMVFITNAIYTRYKIEPPFRVVIKGIFEESSSK